MSPQTHDSILRDLQREYNSMIGYRQHPRCAALAIAGYVSPLFSLIPFATILHDPAVSSLLPDGVPTPIVAFKYEDPLGRRLFNYTSIANLSTAELHAISEGPCICQQPAYAPLVHPDLGHIVTPKIESICSDAHLQALIHLGTKYRALTPSMAVFILTYPPERDERHHHPRFCQVRGASGGGCRHCQLHAGLAQ
jgi:hypothetical protein